VSISIPDVLLHNPVTEAVGGIARKGAHLAVDAVLPDGPAKAGADLLVDHPGAAMDLARDVLRFRGDHPDAAKAIAEIATGAGDRPVQDTALAAVDLVRRDPDAVKDALTTAVDFTAANPDAVGDAIKAFL
jgi:hypothetical protein